MDQKRRAHTIDRSILNVLQGNDFHLRVDFLRSGAFSRTIVGNSSSAYRYLIASRGAKCWIVYRASPRLTMQLRLLLALITAASQANALLRFACSQLVVERFDPLVTPGLVSPHLHQIVGGNAFDIGMHADNDLPTLSTCTTCTYSEDFSNYWTAVLYFKHQNGTFQRVPQRPGELLGAANGGMTLYYMQPTGGGKVTSFKKGFRMIIGDPMLRTFNSSSGDANNLNFRCLSAGGGNGGTSGSPGTDTRNLPAKACAGGIRSEIVFPSCWDGVNLDPPDHRSHMAYPASGKCPASHPVTVPTIFIETIWDTPKFNNLWPSGTAQPFVYSMGDPTGYGQHADYVFGWKGDALQRAMDQCNSFGGACPTLKTQSIDAINRCTQKSRVRESVDGALAALPGCNPVQPGPARATMVPSCDATTDYDADGGPKGGAPVAAPTSTHPTPSTSNPPSSSTVSAPPTASTPAAPSTGQAAHYAQCGGTGYTGPTVCVAPYKCTYTNQYYSQCL